MSFIHSTNIEHPLRARHCEQNRHFGAGKVMSALKKVKERMGSLLIREDLTEDVTFA